MTEDRSRRIERAREALAARDEDARATRAQQRPAAGDRTAVDHDHDEPAREPGRRQEDRRQVNR